MGSASPAISSIVGSRAALLCGRGICVIEPVKRIALRCLRLQIGGLLSVHGASRTTRKQPQPQDLGTMDMSWRLHAFRFDNLPNGTSPTVFRPSQLLSARNKQWLDV